MGAAIWVETAVVTVRHVRDVLSEKPCTFSFFQAVRLMHRFDAHREPLSAYTRPGEQVVRLSVPPAISFPASEIQALEPDGSSAPVMTVNFLGLIGPQGVLPYWYSVVIDEAVRNRNQATRAFFDIFQHRMLALFYRAWEKGRPEVAWERGAADSLAPVIRSVVGLEAPGLQHRFSVPDTALMFYAGLLGPTQRSAIGLEQLLSDYFDLPIAVEQFVGGWYSLEPQALLRLGDEGNESTELGLGTVIGDAIWNEQARVRVRVGPVSREVFEQFLPTSDAFVKLRELLQFYTDDSVQVELQLVMRFTDVSGVVLGDTAALPLGWGTWISTRQAANDNEDVVIPL